MLHTVPKLLDTSIDMIDTLLIDLIFEDGRMPLDSQVSRLKEIREVVANVKVQQKAKDEENAEANYLYRRAIKGLEKSQ